MFIIMDEREAAHWERGPLDNSISTLATHSGQLMQVAEYVIVLKDETYEVLKDRFAGDSGEFPLEELPELLKQRLIQRLKIRDQIHTDEE